MAEETPDLPQDDAPGASPEPSDQPVIDDSGDESLEEPRRDRVSERFAKLTRALSDKDRAIQQLRDDIQRLQLPREAPPAVEPPAVPVGRPRVEDYPDYDGYVEAMAEWKAEQKFVQREQQSQQAKLREEQTVQAQTWQERVQAAQAKYTDWDEVLQGANVPVTLALQEALLTSEHGADVLYYLARHEDEARRLTALRPLDVARAIGRIEAGLSVPSSPNVPSPTPAPPPPVRPVGTGTSGGSRDPGSMSPQEYRAWRERQRR